MADDLTHKTKRDQILLARKLTPSLSYKEIARAVGCSPAYVQQICFENGAGRGAKKSKWKAKYVAMRTAHPGWSISRIAKELGAPRSYIYRLQSALDPNFEGVIRLGRAAKNAGLTIKQIREMAHARHI